MNPYFTSDLYQTEEEEGEEDNSNLCNDRLFSWSLKFFLILFDIGIIIVICILLCRCFKEVFRQKNVEGKNKKMTQTDPLKKKKARKSLNAKKSSKRNERHVRFNRRIQRISLWELNSATDCRFINCYCLRKESCLIMNPICKTDINSMECQNWMSEVYDRCRQLFTYERKDPFAAWWHDNTPALYKSNIEAMTAYDCHKLKRDLGRQVAEVMPKPFPTLKNHHRGGKLFLWWHKLLLIMGCVGFSLFIFIICWCCRCCYAPKGRSVNLPEEGKPIEKKPKKKRTVKGWVRHKVRPVFVHSEKTLQRQKSLRQQEDRAHAAHTQRKIKKWTLDRQQAVEEAKQREIAREEKKASNV